jgi:hypothetical protein
VGISLLKLYSNKVTSLGLRPLRRGGIVVAMHWRGRGWKPEYKHTLLLFGDQTYILPVTVHTFHLIQKTCLTNLG